MSYDKFLEKIVEYLENLFEDAYMKQYEFRGYTFKDGIKGITIRDNVASNILLEFIQETI